MWEKLILIVCSALTDLIANLLTFLLMSFLLLTTSYLPTLLAVY